MGGRMGFKWTPNGAPVTLWSRYLAPAERLSFEKPPGTVQVSGSQPRFFGTNPDPRSGMAAYWIRNGDDPYQAHCMAWPKDSALPQLLSPPPLILPQVPFHSRRGPPRDAKVSDAIDRTPPGGLHGCRFG